MFEYLSELKIPDSTFFPMKYILKWIQVRSQHKQEVHKTKWWIWFLINPYPCLKKNMDWVHISMLQMGLLALLSRGKALFQLYYCLKLPGMGHDCRNRGNIFVGRFSFVNSSNKDFFNQTSRDHDANHYIVCTFVYTGCVCLHQTWRLCRWADYTVWPVISRAGSLILWLKQGRNRVITQSWKFTLNNHSCVASVVKVFHTQLILAVTKSKELRVVFAISEIYFIWYDIYNFHSPSQFYEEKKKNWHG